MIRERVTGCRVTISIYMLLDIGCTACLRSSQQTTGNLQWTFLLCFVIGCSWILWAPQGTKSEGRRLGT